MVTTASHISPLPNFSHHYRLDAGVLAPLVTSPVFSPSFPRCPAMIPGRMVAFVNAITEGQKFPVYICVLSDEKYI